MFRVFDFNLHGHNFMLNKFFRNPAHSASITLKTYPRFISVLERALAKPLKSSEEPVIFVVVSGWRISATSTFERKMIIPEPI